MTKTNENIPVLDHDALEKLTGYQSGSQSLIDALFSAFQNSAELSLIELNEGWEKRDFKCLSEAAHRLKSTSSTLGLSRITAICKRIETAKEILPDMQDVLIQLNNEIEAALDALFGKTKG